MNSQLPVFNIHEAKTQLSKILSRVEKGGEVMIARAGKAIAKLVPIPSVHVPPARKFGALRGVVLHEAEDVWEPSDEVADLFEGSGLLNDEAAD